MIYASTDINTGAFSQTIGDNKKRSGTNENNNGNYGGFEFDASRSNSIYGNSTTVQPTSLEMTYCIKF